MIKLKFLFLFLFLFIFGGFSSVAFGENYCDTYLSDGAGIIPHYSDFWNIKEDGSFNLDKNAKAEYRRSYYHEGSNGEIYIGENPPIGYKRVVKLTLDANKRVSQMEIKDTPFDIEKFSQETVAKVITLGFKGGKCYPLSKSRVLVDRQLTDFNTDACRELQNYLDRNKQALDCKCGTDRTNQVLQNILDAHHIASPSWFEMSDTKPINAKQAKNGWLINDHNQLSKPLWRTLMLIEDCKRTPGVNAAFDDKKLWQVTDPEADKNTKPVNEGTKGI